jgi:hypothetical protein
MTKQQYEANARNVYNLLKVTAEGLKKAREAKRELNYGKEKDKDIVVE